jgi:hypothetical protein
MFSHHFFGVEYHGYHGAFYLRFTGADCADPHWLGHFDRHSFEKNRYKLIYIIFINILLIILLYYNTHRIHGAGIDANIGGILMGSMEHHV